MIEKTALPGVTTVKGFDALIQHISAELNSFHKKTFAKKKAVKKDPIPQYVNPKRSFGAFK
jgi:hypothetical protein